MKRSLITLASTIAVAFASAGYAGDYHMPAKAPVYVDPDPTGYVFAYGGFAFGHDTDSSINAGGLLGIGTVAINNDYDGGYILGGGVGIYTDFMKGSRFEFEGLHSSRDHETVAISVPAIPFAGSVPLGGELDTQAFFFNVVKEFPIGRMTGYAGGGFGIANTEWSLNSGALLGGFIPPLGLSGSDTSLAYQFKVGVDVPVGERLSLFTEYKLIGVTDSDSTALILPVNTDGFVSHHVVFGAKIDF